MIEMIIIYFLKNNFIHEYWITSFILLLFLPPIPPTPLSSTSSQIHDLFFNCCYIIIACIHMYVIYMLDIYVYIKILSPFNAAHMHMCLEWLLRRHPIGSSHPEKNLILTFLVTIDCISSWRELVKFSSSMVVCWLILLTYKMKV